MSNLGDGTYTNRPQQIVASNVTAIAAGHQHSLFLKSDGSLWAMGNFSGLDSEFGLYFVYPELIDVNVIYNQITSQLVSGGNVSLSFLGNAFTNYALDRSFSLSQPKWIPQVTNPANYFGALFFTNTPDPTTNNFWRIRSVP